MRVSVVTCGALLILLFVSSTAFADPTIEVWDPSSNYACNGWCYIMQSVIVNTTGTPEQFTIGNEVTCTNTLYLTGNPLAVAKSGNNPSNFTVVQPASTALVPGTTTTFTVAFSATTVGFYDAMLTIPSNDPANPSFVIYVACEAIPDCEINVKQGATNLPCGSGIYDFGDVVVGKTSAAVTFTIENLGTTPLNLTSVGGYLVNIFGNPTFFTIDCSMTSTPIAASGSTTFQIVFNPDDLLTFTAMVIIYNDDTNENPYEFYIKGTGIKPKFDFNGDGYNDAIVGAPADDDGGANSGCVYIFYGSANPSATIDASAADVKLVGGDAGDGFGTSVSDAGDVNGDGYSDLIIGAPYDDDGGADSGCAFIFFGSSSPSSTIDATAANVKLVGENAVDHFGISVSGAGDIDDDDYFDVIVGADLWDDAGPVYSVGSAYIFKGRNNASWSSATPIDGSNADIQIIGEGAGHKFGGSVSNAGNINDDDNDDIIIGATGADPNGTSSGRAYIFFGDPTLPSTVYAANADVIINGDSAFDYFGCSVSNAGNVNDDDYDDVIIGAYGDDNGGAFIFFGRDTAAWNSLTPCDAANADVKIVCINANDAFGFSVSYAGDVNNDGIDDIIVGAYNYYNGASYVGAAFIFFGDASIASISAAAADVRLLGVSNDDSFGCSVGFVGDINHDGYDDVIVGANLDDDGGATSGCAFIFYGRSSGSWSAATPISASNASVTLVGADAGDEFGESVAGGR